MSNYITIKLRRGTAAQWTATNPVLAEGEFGAETDTRKFKIGNGVTAWNSLQYWGGGGGAANFTDLGDVPASYSGQGGKYVKVKSTADGLEFGTLTIAAGDLPSAIDATKIADGSVSNAEFQTLNGASATFTSAKDTKLSGIETGADVTDADNVGSVLNAATSKTTPVDADTIPLSDSAAAGGLKKLSWANLKATAKTYFDTIYQAALGFTPVNKAGDTSVGSLNLGSNTLTAATIQANSSAGGIIKSSSGSAVAEWGAGGGQNITFEDGIKLNGGTASRILATDASKNVQYLDTTTYPNLTELAYVKGVTSAVQTQLDGKVDENAAITPATKTKISYDVKGLVTAGADAAIADITGLQTALDGKVDENAAITGATKTKITYDAKGLVTAGADATTADIADSSNKRYVTDAQLTVIGNTSGTNTGDQNLFSKVAVAGQSDVVADSTGDTLTLVAGSNITITTDASTDSITIASTGGGGGVSDGDKGDITVSSSGTVWTVDNKAVSLAKIQDITTARILGRVTASTGVTEELTGTQATTLLDTFTSSLKGLAPASGGGTSNFLRADGTWAAPPTGSAGTVISPSQITSWQNNYNPTSWASTVQTLRLDGNSAFNFITGLTATTGGHRVKLLNVGSNPIGMLDASTSSTAANRFEFGGRDLVLLPGRAMELEYDGTSSRWRAAESVNIWSEVGEWVNFDRVELYHRNVSNIGAHHLAYLTASGTLAENNGGSGGIRPRIGVVTLGTGTSSSSRALLAPAAQNFRMYVFHDGTSYVNYHYYESSIRISALSDAADIFSIKCGWLNSDSASSVGAETNGLFLMYRHNLNSGQWVLRAVNNTTITEGNSTSAVAAATWYRVKVIAYPDGTAAAYVNGTLVATLASGLPGSGQDCAPMTIIRKEGGTTGTTARSIDLDYMAIGTIYNSAR